MPTLRGLVQTLREIVPTLRGNSADPPGEYEQEKENATERLAFSFFIFCGTEFALENRIYWLCRLAGANMEARAPG